MTDWNKETPVIDGQYHYKTTLLNGFPYYVKVNSVEKHENKGIPTSSVWKCTLLQPTDNEVKGPYDFHFPPKTQYETKFWNHLKKRKHASTKQNQCDDALQRAMDDMDHEIALLEENPPPSRKSAASPTTPKKTLPSTPKKTLPTTPKKTPDTPEEDDIFQARVYCAERKWRQFLTGTGANACLESENKEDGVFHTIIGRIVNLSGVDKEKREETITVELYSLHSHAKEKIESLAWFKPNVKVPVKYDPMYSIWRTYERIRKLPINQYFSVLLDSGCVNGFVSKNKDDIKVQLWMKGSTDEFTDVPIGEGPVSENIWRKYELEDGKEKTGCTVPVTLKDAGGNGNCFYYSLFEALSNRGLLLKTKDILKISTSKEGFNTTFREYVSKNMKLDDFVKSMKHLKTTELDTFKVALEGFPQDIVNAFNSSNEADIPKQIRESMKTPCTYVTQLEVQAIQELLLEKCNILLHVLSTPWTTSPNQAHALNIPNRIVLVNLGNEHYQYYEFPTTKGGKRNTRRTQKRRNPKKKTLRRSRRT